MKLENLTFLLVRLVVGYAFLLHGTAKFFEFPISMTGGNGGVELMSIYGAAGILEIGGGVLLILGLFTRVTGFILAGQMAYAYFFVHGGNVLQPMLNGGELAVVYCMIFLMFIYTGAGKYSIDYLIFGQKPNLNLKTSASGFYNEKNSDKPNS